MITFKIPITNLKQSTNKIYAGIHWAKRKEFKDSVLSYAAVFCRKYEPITSWPVSIRYRFIFKSRPLDTLNTAYISKCFEDAFRAFGILPDDTPEFVSETILQVVGKSRSNEPGKKKADKAQREDDWLEVEIKSIN